MEVTKNKSEEDELLSPCISEVDDFFGDPQVLTRVGDEYQAEIPHLSLKDGYQNCSKNFQQLDADNNASSLNSWSDAEYNSFLLGLYVFGKNFNLVKKFVESKQMGEILLFYYGKFYGSAGYRRWSDCRKVRSRRCVSGQKIFTGWRLQELLSRLSCRVSVVCQKPLIEVCRMFEHGTTPFEDFVFTLKETVGTANLVTAVGIGSGKQDLSSTAESTRKYNALPARPEIPVGEAWSSLSPVEIIRFLKGDFRLSKARSSDLFWEAVWPRLLARGWHSEQPQDQGVSGSKHSLVFLVPGIQEFSRERLVKGNQYFDSVTDILNKVALDPALLELHLKAEEGVTQMEEHPLSASDMNGAIKRQSHRYLQPRNSKGNFSSMNFMIVDTSLIHQGKSTVRELRHLPIELTGVSADSFDNDRKRRDPCEGPIASHKLDSFSNIEKNVIDQGTSSDSSNCFSPDADKTTSCPEENLTKLKDTARDDSCFAERNLPKSLKKRRHDGEMKSGHSHDAGIKVEQQNLGAFPPEQIKGELDNISERRLHESKSFHSSSSPVESKKMVLWLDSSRNIAKTSPLADGFKDELTLGSCQNPSTSMECDNTRTLFDLNLPQVSTDTVAAEPIRTEGGLSCSATPTSPGEQQDELKLSNRASTTEMPLRSCRRQSTRNRPLTTRALEAIECGLFGIKRNRKSTKSTKKAPPAAPPTYVEMNNQTATSDNGCVYDTADCKNEGQAEVKAAE